MNSDPTSPTPTTATKIFCWLAVEDMMDRVRSKRGVATKNLARTDGRMIWTIDNMRTNTSLSLSFPPPSSALPYLPATLHRLLGIEGRVMDS